MQIQENISLRPYNSFAIDARARYFSVFRDATELEEILEEQKTAPALVLGGGSNILLTGDIDGLVLKNEIPGVQELHEDEQYVYVKAGAGENWHGFVQHCIERNWGGVENLSLIPGHVGATPMQNIGAYGVEIEDVFHSLEAFHLLERKLVTFTAADCAFGYRDSVFKHAYRGQFVILSVTYRLCKKHRFHTGYGSLEEELEKMGVQELSLRAVADAVIRIRRSKLPDPAQLPNAGSFFKNPEVSREKYQQLLNQFPAIVAHPVPNGQMKLAAGWLIEHCGPAEGQSWKGYREGDAGCHERQALVLVNFGQASGRDIYALSERILQSVESVFGVKLEREVNII